MIRPSDPRAREITGLARVSLYRAVGRGELPRPRKLGARASGWLHSELVAFRDRFVAKDAA
ncbi:MAG: AlpA family phage regulatory protein [Holophagales bacterium]|nr:MAG: AlpA family phage regulatory protein [Holophagales bacterium]